MLKTDYKIIMCYFIDIFRLKVKACFRILFSTDVDDDGNFLRRVQKKILYYGKSNFTVVSSICFENTHNNYSPVYVRITKGGIGNHYFEVSLKSDKGQGVKVNVKCFGYL